MVKTIIAFTLAAVANAALEAPKIVADASKVPVIAKVAVKHATISEAQKKTMHSGCLSACKPSPVESKCVTACEAAMYRCIDETGPNENEKDTKACHDKTLKLYEETKGLEKKDGGNSTSNSTKAEGKKEEKKAEKKAKMFLQLQDSDADDDADDSAISVEEETDDGSDADTEEAQGDDEETADSDAESEEEPADDDESLLQVSKKDSDDDDAEAGGEVGDDSATSGGDEEEQEGEEADESLLQVSKKDSDDDDAEAGGEVGDDSATSGGDEEQEGEEADESFVQTALSKKTEWKPEPCDELEPGVPCTHLYEHPQGSTVVMPCPVERQTAPESCRALFGDKADGQQCPQITCPKALGVTMKLICGGGCCPSCWAPDHVVKLDRHTSVDDAAVVDPAPQAPSTCGGVKCFELNCAPGFTKGFVNGDCCYSCVQGR